MKNLRKYSIKQYISAGISLLKKIVAQCIGYIFYDPKYLKGKEFSSYKYSNGWRWVMECFFIQKIIGYQRHIPFPVTPSMQVMNWENIHFDVNDIGIFQRAGSYFQAAADAHIYIGKGSYIAGNVGIITANHDLFNIDRAASGKDVLIGEKNWIGMNVMILPGVVLGNHTIVAAGSVVTKSFPEGYCVLAGNPARILKTIDMDKCAENIDRDEVKSHEV